MPDEIAIDSGGSSMVRDMKTVPTDMPLLRSIQVLERYFMLQCIVYMYIHVLYFVTLEQAVRAWPTKVTPFPLYKLGVPSRFDFGRTGGLKTTINNLLKGIYPPPQIHGVYANANYKTYKSHYTKAVHVPSACLHQL